MVDFTQTIGDNVRLYMELYGYNQVDLAAAMGISPSAVRSWLKYGHTPRAKQIEQLCEIFNCTYERLVTPQTAETIRHDILTNHIIDAVNKLNDEGKKKVLQYAGDLAERYKK